MNKDWLDIDVLEDYLNGKLDAKAMHLIEKQALDDPFVAEALEGLSQSPKRKQNLSLLQKQLHDRIADQPAKRKIWGITTHRLSIAATATVAFIAVSILFFMRETNRRNEIANRRAKGVIVNLDTASIAMAKSKTIKTEKTKDEHAAALAKNNKPPVHNHVASEHLLPEQSSVESAEKQSVIASSPIVHAFALKGKVVAQGDGGAIPGASIKLSGTNNTAVADVKGNFSLKVDSNTKPTAVDISAVGYAKKSVILNSDKNTEIVLKEDTNALSEVVVNHGNKESSIGNKLQGSISGLAIVDKARPTVDFQQYLAENNRLTKIVQTGNEVGLSFLVNPKGRPVQIKIVKGSTLAENKEAVRLIQDGPDWIYPKSGSKNPVQLNIKF